MNKERVNNLKSQGIEYLSQLIEYSKTPHLKSILSNINNKLSSKEIESILNCINDLPDI